MKIQILDGELWWGGVVDFGAQMPYDSDSDCEIAAGNDGEDQSSPVFLSSKGRYLWSGKPFRISFKGGVIQIDDSDQVELAEGFGDLKGAHKAFARAHFQNYGKMPNEQFFRAPQYNTWIEFMYNQNQKGILAYARSIDENGMMPGILMIDEGWSEDYGVFDFYPGRFESPKEMMAELHRLGFTVMLWVTPHISPDSNAFRELRDTDYLIRDKTGEFAVRKWWNGFSCVLDLSNPGACEWLKGKLEHVMDEYSVDGFKFDAGDPYMYACEDRTFVRQLPQDHTADYSRFAAQYEFNELRAVWNMGAEPLVCRLHDKLHSWDNDGLNCIIPNTIVQGLLGYYYGCPDMVGGGSYGSFLGDGFKVDEELYIRWLQACILCPMIQFSIAPWRILSKENYRIVKNLLALRQRYIPYLLETARKASREHEPIIRPLEYEFPGSGYGKEQGMYLLGDRYLVVPLLEKGKNTRMVTLPEGCWKESDGKLYLGGERTELHYSLEKVYIFERMNEKP